MLYCECDDFVMFCFVKKFGYYWVGVVDFGGDFGLSGLF